MRILKIKQPGLYINLTGTNPTRTPCEVDITRCDLNIILIELRSYGIDNFEILNKTDIPDVVSTERKLPNHNEIEKSTLKYLDRKYIPVNKIRRKSNKPNEYNFLESDKISNKFERIEKLLEELVSLEKLKTDNEEQNKNKSTKIEEIEEPNVEDFIPDIDLSGLKYNKGK